MKKFGNWLSSAVFSQYCNFWFLFQFLGFLHSVFQISNNIDIFKISQSIEEEIWQNKILNLHCTETETGKYMKFFSPKCTGYNKKFTRAGVYARVRIKTPPHGWKKVNFLRKLGYQVLKNGINHPNTSKNPGFDN